jgi:hypothetical protein
MYAVCVLSCEIKKAPPYKQAKESRLKVSSAVTLKWWLIE